MHIVLIPFNDEFRLIKDGAFWYDNYFMNAV
jgi:hypothetical protein